jgi:outer membrane protein
MIWATLLCGLLALAVTAWGQETPIPPGAVVTLEQAVALALQNNRLVKNAALEVEKAADNVAAARTRRFPALKVQVLESYLLTSVDFTFERGAFGTFPGIGPVPAEDTKISTPRRPTTLVVAQVTQPLSQLYRIGLGVRLQEVGGAVAHEQLRLQQQTIVYDVKRFYYGMLQTMSALEASEEALKSYRELNRLVADYVRHQRALKADLLDVQTRLRKAEYEALTLRNTLATQQEQLNNLLGLDLLTEFQVSPVSDTTPFADDPEAARRRALAQRPEVKEAQLKVQQAEYDRRMKKAEYIPDISLAFNYLTPFNVELVPKNIASVGVLLTWEPFDWGRKHREAAEKHKSVVQARHAAHEAEASVVLEVRSRLRKLQETAALLQVNQLAEETAKEKLRVAMNKYTEQAALLQDVLQAQATLADANHQYRQALLSFWTTRAEFEKALGEN